MATVGHDLRVGLRGLRRDWLVNLVAALSLALALAGNTTVFSVINAVLSLPSPRMVVMMPVAPSMRRTRLLPASAT